VWRAPLEDALTQSNVAGNKDAVAAAAHLLEMVKQLPGTGNFSLSIGGSVQGLVQGNDAHVSMTFGDHKRADSKETT
jgi:hypothetical protein